MLAPSTESTRRPSSTADLILSRSDSRAVRCNKSADDPGDHYQHAHLSPSGSIHSAHSAPLSASSSACWSGAAVAAASGSPDYSRSSTPCASPEARRRYWCRRLMKLKDDMDRFGDGFRRSVRGSIGSLATRLSPSLRRRRSRNGDGGVERLRGNGISVDIVRDAGDARHHHHHNHHHQQQRSRSADRSRSGVRLDELTTAAGDDDYRVPSPLKVTALRDGAFTGEIALDRATSITVRRRDYRLEFYVPEDERPQFVGSVSIPIYVDPASLRFQLNASDAAVGAHLLRVEGRMKGCGAPVGDVGPRRLSMSANDLRLAKVPSASARRERPVWVIGDGL